MGVPSLRVQELRALSAQTSARAPHDAGPNSAPRGPTPQAPALVESVTEESRQVAKSHLPERTGTRLRFDEDSKRIVAQIVNEANEVIRQVPPEEVLRIAAKLRRLQGILFDETA